MYSMQRGERSSKGRRIFAGAVCCLGLFPVVHGSHSGDLPENLGKISKITIANLKRHPVDGHTAFRQKAARSRYTFFRYILHKGQARFFFEQPGQMIRADKHNIRQIISLDILCIVGI